MANVPPSDMVERMALFFFFNIAHLVQKQVAQEADDDEGEHQITVIVGHERVPQHQVERTAGNNGGMDSFLFLIK